jgi:hypothetical protein
MHLKTRRRVPNNNNSDCGEVFPKCLCECITKWLKAIPLEEGKTHEWFQQQYAFKQSGQSVSMCTAAGRIQPQTTTL